MNENDIVIIVSDADTEQEFLAECAAMHKAEAEYNARRQQVASEIGELRKANPELSLTEVHAIWKQTKKNQ